MKKNTELIKKNWKPVLVILVVFLCIFHKQIWNLVKDWDPNIISIILNALVAALGFRAIYISVKTDKEIKRYEYVSDYNFHFLTSKQFFLVEKKLETCFQKYKKVEDRETMIKNCRSVFFPDFEKFLSNKQAKKKEPTDLYKYIKYDEEKEISANYQNIINYLVYLESFTPLLLNKQLEYKDVDDVFGYRFFIAVNNPFIQECELLNDWKYYRGCIKIYQQWVDYRDNKIDIPLDQFNLMDKLKDNSKTDDELKDFLDQILPKKAKESVSSGTSNEKKDKIEESNQKS